MSHFYCLQLGVVHSHWDNYTHLLQPPQFHQDKGIIHTLFILSISQTHRSLASSGTNPFKLLGIFLFFVLFCFILFCFFKFNRLKEPQMWRETLIFFMLASFSPSPNLQLP